MTTTTSTRGRSLTLLHVVHALVWRDRPEPHRCRVAGCVGDTGEPPVDRFDVWGPDGPPAGVVTVDVTMLRRLRRQSPPGR